MFTVFLLCFWRNSQDHTDYNVTSSLNDWAHARDDPWSLLKIKHVVCLGNPCSSTPGTHGRLIFIIGSVYLVKVVFILRRGPFIHFIKHVEDKVKHLPCAYSSITCNHRNECCIFHTFSFVRFYRFLLADMRDNFNVRIKDTIIHTFVGGGINADPYSEIRSVWQDPLCCKYHGFECRTF